ncbi:MAG: hypothetical protein JJ947_11170 [Altererythrobacter sp.]|uniref:hypothetical protein n=1 Tax=Altererythrobacter sp. TaxID=1872480 RepID=UPI001B26D878|nr:hypothetical protein [Altererythrobacter sp.]MBO6642791.1 hypothetical protein [Altererythrobacter sp.]MBO6708701.1 hypothetical protein [Altererythrobacter sp.]
MTNQHETDQANPPSWFGALKWGAMRQKDRANEKRVNNFAYMWVGLLVGANVLRYAIRAPEPVVLAVVLISIIPGLLLVKAYLKMLREADEMLRQLQFEALAVGFGAGFVCGLTAMFLFPPGPVWGFATLVPMVLGFCTRVILAGRKMAQTSSTTVEDEGLSE